MKLILTALLLLLSFPCFSKGTYLAPDTFIQNTFDGSPPPVSTLWLTAPHLQHLAKILEHPSSQLRVRYWQKNGKSAWILNEIGKEKPITLGVVIEQQQIKQVAVLIFLESRGWEIKHDYFTQQFSGLRLTDDHKLSQSIDGITGATLSVNAVQKMARVALYLSQQIPL